MTNLEALCAGCGHTPQTCNCEQEELRSPVEILNRAWNHLWLDSEDDRPLGLELIELHAAMERVKGEQGSTLIPVVIVITLVTMTALLLAGSGLLQAVMNKLAEVR